MNATKLLAKYEMLAEAAHRTGAYKCAREWSVKAEKLEAVISALETIEEQTMTIKEAMSQAHQHIGTTGIFYNPATMDAVFAEHGQEPKRYLIWCDCSRVVQQIKYYGGIDEAYKAINR